MIFKTCSLTKSFCNVFIQRILTSARVASGAVVCCRRHCRSPRSKRSNAHRLPCPSPRSFCVACWPRWSCWQSSSQESSSGFSFPLNASVMTSSASRLVTSRTRPMLTSLRATFLSPKPFHCRPDFTSFSKYLHEVRAYVFNI